MTRRVTLEIISLSFIFLFMYAATSKLKDMETFHTQLAQSPLLTAFASWIVWVIPAIEIMISLMLAIRVSRTIGLYAAFSLMVIFTAYIVVILNFSEYIPCSCGGILARMSWRDHLIFNIAFCGLAVGGIILQNNIHRGETDASKILAQHGH